MADIILKDRNGVEVTHEGVKTIKMQNIDGAYTPYHILPGNMRFYITRRGSASGLFYVLGESSLSFNFDYGSVVLIDDVYNPESEYASDGYSDSFFMVATPKILQKGREYTLDEMVK